jgi:hypothetical protein
MRLAKVLSLLTVTLVLMGSITTTENINQCLSKAQSLSHRLDRLDEIKACLTRHVSGLSKNECHSLVEKKSSLWGSIKLTEEARLLCFYETPSGPDIRTCLRDAKKIQDASRHDEAVFYCYQQFQEKLSLDDCLFTARQMIYPVKMDHLKQHCLNKN